MSSILCGGALSLLALALAQTAHAHTTDDDGTRVTLNLRDADISTLIATVSEVTGKNFVVDPRVKGKVNVISSSPMDADGVYATFLSVLEVNGFAAIPSGESIKIVPEANLRTEGGTHVGAANGLAGDEIVTRVFDIHNGSAAQLMPILRPLVATSGQLAAYNSSNSLIVSDRASNVQRLERLIAQIDQNGDRTVEIVHLENAVADDVVKSLTALAQQNKQADPGAAQASVISDVRTNSVLVSGDKSERDKLIALIHELDQPSSSKGDTQVIYLKYADAQSLAALLSGNPQPSRSSSSSNGGSMFGNSNGGRSSFGGNNPFGGNSSNTFGSTLSTPNTASSPAAPSGGTSSNNPDLRVLADVDTNALVVTAPPKVMQQVRLIIAQLDIKRSEVLVEAIFAEVSADKASNLGVDWLAYNPNAIGAASITNSSTASAISSLTSSLATTASGSSSANISNSALYGALATACNNGGCMLLGAKTSNGSIYGALIQALASDADTNILSTPTLTTLDNQEATIEVGQTVPVLTGSYANSGVTNASGVVNPFQTLNQQDVGLKLGITPTIGEGDTVRLKLEFEDSSIASGTAGTSSFITNKRTVTNTVTIDNGQILVIGGLIDDQITDRVTRIPGLSDIPMLGSLFKSRSVNHNKQNLMIFIRPVILRERDEGDYFTRRKYQETRQAQINAANGPVPLMGGRAPVLYQYDEYLKNNSISPTTKTPPPPQSNSPAAAAPAAGP